MRAVFFDAGETLLAPHPSFHELFAEVLRMRGRPVDPRRVAEAFERVAPTFLEVLDRAESQTWSTSRETSRRFWGKVYSVAFDELGVSDPGGELAGALYSKFTRHDSYRLFDDALPALRQVRAAGLITGLISNFEEWLEEMLHAFEAGPLFDVMVISGKEGVEKPDPAIFRTALERAEVEAADAVYVGDHPLIDVAAAQAAGMTGVLIDRRGRHPGHAGPRVESLEQLMPLLLAIDSAGAGISTG